MTIEQIRNLAQSLADARASHYRACREREAADKACREAGEAYQRFTDAFEAALHEYAEQRR